MFGIWKDLPLPQYFANICRKHNKTNMFSVIHSNEFLDMIFKTESVRLNNQTNILTATYEKCNKQIRCTVLPSYCSIFILFITILKYIILSQKYYTSTIACFGITGLLAASARDVTWQLDTNFLYIRQRDSISVLKYFQIWPNYSKICYEIYTIIWEISI